MAPDEVVRFIWDYETDNDVCHQPRDVVRAIINEALLRWKRKKLPADNIAVLIAFLTEAESSDASSLVPSANEEGAPKASHGSDTDVCDTPPASPSLVIPVSESKPVLEFESIMKAQRVNSNLTRSPLKSFAKSPIGKHERMGEDSEEGLPALKRCKAFGPVTKQGLELIMDDDSGVCSDDNSSRPGTESDLPQPSDSPTEDLSQAAVPVTAVA
jgi:hypothetical protein